MGATWQHLLRILSMKSDIFKDIIFQSVKIDIFNYDRMNFESWSLTFFDDFQTV